MAETVGVEVVPYTLPQSRKPLLCYLVLKRNNCVVKTIFIVCLFLLGG